MSARFRRAVVAILVLALWMSLGASSAGALTATVVMKVSRTAQDSIINEGEDLSIDVQIEGVAPSVYRWYFNDALIPGATEHVYSIDGATVEDAGVYRMEAYDDAGKMLLSMDFSVRVIEKAMPKSGDDTIGLMPILLAMAALSAGMAAALVARRRRAAA